MNPVTRRLACSSPTSRPRGPFTIKARRQTHLSRSGCENLNKAGQSLILQVLFAALFASALADFQFTYNGHICEVITTGATWPAQSVDAQNRMMEEPPVFGLAPATWRLRGCGPGRITVISSGRVR